MQAEEILSTGIDIGTSTTQLVFSKIVLQNTSGFGRIPQIKVISKEVIYESDVYFTPLSNPEEIDGRRVSEIIKNEYKKAGIYPEDLATGAVIITGETSRKKNAGDVVKAIAEVAGNFVVATAGADLESVLAGKGAGAEEFSRKLDRIVVNLDIGGGTTNICVFENGKVLDTACLDIGGRLVKIENGIITYVAPKIQWLSKELNLDIKKGSAASEDDLWRLTDIMATILAESIYFLPKGRFLENMKTNHLLTCDKKPEMITFSGGVASCMKEETDIFQYGDIGVMLAKSLQRNAAFHHAKIIDAKETMRATVIGVGNYSMNISGSTIEYTTKPFPLKNIPIVKVLLEKEEDIDNLSENLHKAMQLFLEEKKTSRQVAIAMKGLKCPSFAQILKIAENISVQYEKECTQESHLIIVLEEDIGKAIGQALRHRLGTTRSIICIDGICCESGDFIDIGEPVALGNVLPVIVKTLIFNG